MKYLCIDYGKKKVGIATSDDGGEMAFPCMVLENNKVLIVEIKQLCKELKIGAIVVGESVDQNGKPNTIAKDARAFAVQLEDTLDLPLYFEKEWMTSVHARVMQEGKEVVDDSAAALILQRHLDKKNKVVAQDEGLPEEEDSE
ncbi:MAG: Holliday junction resolvase RuvX [Minisyncoccia bacterium]